MGGPGGGVHAKRHCPEPVVEEANYADLISQCSFFFGLLDRSQQPAETQTRKRVARGRRDTPNHYNNFT
jgi:hypothetical protein